MAESPPPPKGPEPAQTEWFADWGKPGKWAELVLQLLGLLGP
jgi:hypothetical protein